MKLDFEVMSRSMAGDTLTSVHRFKWVISIVDPLTGPCMGFRSVAPERRLHIQFDDVTHDGSRFGYQRATREQVEQIVEFCERVDGPCLIHCEAGISRSSAVAIILYAVKLGPGNEMEAVATVAKKGMREDGSNRYCPNEWLIFTADQIMVRRQELTAAYIVIFEEGIRFAAQESR